MARKADPRGQAAKRISRPRGQREWVPSARQLEIYHAVVEGQDTQAVIARRYDVSPATVSVLVRRVNNWLFPQYFEDIRGIKVSHTKALERVFIEAMKAWDRSKKPAVTDTIEDGKLTRRVQYQCGDPAYLAKAREALADIRKIWGADAPVHVEHSGELRVAGKTPEEATAELLEEMADAMNRLTAATKN